MNQKNTKGVYSGLDTIIRILKAIDLDGDSLAAIISALNGASTEAKQDDLITLNDAANNLLVAIAMNTTTSKDVGAVDIDTLRVVLESALRDPLLFDLWVNTIGNTVALEYWGAVSAGNPSGNKNLKTVKYASGGLPLLTQTYTYDIDDDVILISAI